MTDLTEEVINVLKQDHVVIAKKDLPEGLKCVSERLSDPALINPLQKDMLVSIRTLALVAEQLEEKNMSKDKMPDVIHAWMGLQDSGSWDANEDVCTPPASKYHHDRKYQAALDAIEVAKGALNNSLEWMEHLRVCGDAGSWEWKNDEYTEGKEALAAIDAVLEGEKNHVCDYKCGGSINFRHCEIAMKKER